MNERMMEALRELAAHRGISEETLLSVLADAIDAAYQKMPGAEEYSWVVIDPERLEFRVMAQHLNEDGEPVGEEYDVTPDDMGRIAAQAAKQVMTHRIREAERELKYEEYAGREGGIVTGVVQQNDQRYALLDLGRVEALMPQSEQVPHERLQPGERVKAYIVEVRKTSKGPQIVVSRTHPGLIRRLFEMEVPEIDDGVVEIKACAREPGQRTKIAVWSSDPNIDPVGACVGARGARVRQVVNELRGEKVDIVNFSEDDVDFVAKALQPAKVRDVIIDYETAIARVVVPDFQLSLAIGKEGQNARLAHRLTGFRIDITSETDFHSESFADEVPADWAEGEWVADDTSGEQMWHPADGSPPITVEEWNAMVAGAGNNGPDEEVTAGQRDSVADQDGEASEASAADQDGEASVADQDREASEASAAEDPAEADVSNAEGDGLDRTGETSRDDGEVDAEDQVTDGNEVGSGSDEIAETAADDEPADDAADADDTDGADDVGDEEE